MGRPWWRAGGALFPSFEGCLRIKIGHARLAEKVSFETLMPPGKRTIITNATRIDLWMTTSLIGCLLGLSLASGCNPLDELTSDESTPLPEKRAGQIPPTAFVFAKITDPGQTVGGWWTGCLHLNLQRSADDTEEDRPKRVTCTLEFGFPILTEMGGRMSMRKAQEAAAEITNQAKASVPLKGRMATEICTDFKKTVIRMAEDARKGSRIMEQCHTHGQVPEFSWP